MITDVGNTVNVAQASYANSMGSPALAVVWTDLDYDVSQEALYYAQAIEIPTSRHSTYDARAEGIESPQPQTIQERAVSPAIWVSPEKSLWDARCAALQSTASCE